MSPYEFRITFKNTERQFRPELQCSLIFKPNIRPFTSLAKNFISHRKNATVLWASLLDRIRFFIQIPIYRSQLLWYSIPCSYRFSQILD